MGELLLAGQRAERRRGSPAGPWGEGGGNTSPLTRPPFPHTPPPVVHGTTTRTCESISPTDLCTLQAIFLTFFRKYNYNLQEFLLNGDIKHVAVVSVFTTSVATVSTRRPRRRGRNSKQSGGFRMTWVVFSELCESTDVWRCSEKAPFFTFSLEASESCDPRTSRLMCECEKSVSMKSSGKHLNLKTFLFILCDHRKEIRHDYRVVELVRRVSHRSALKVFLGCPAPTRQRTCAAVSLLTSRVTRERKTRRKKAKLDAVPRRARSADD